MHINHRTSEHHHPKHRDSRRLTQKRRWSNPSIQFLRLHRSQRARTSTAQPSIATRRLTLGPHRLLRRHDAHEHHRRRKRRQSELREHAVRVVCRLSLVAGRWARTPRSPRIHTALEDARANGNVHPRDDGYLSVRCVHTGGPVAVPWTVPSARTLGGRGGRYREFPVGARASLHWRAGVVRASLMCTDAPETRSRIAGRGAGGPDGRTPVLFASLDLVMSSWEVESDGASSGPYGYGQAHACFLTIHLKSWATQSSWRGPVMN